MGRRLLPAILVGFAVLEDLLGSHRLAGDALLCALPFASVGALLCLGDHVDARGTRPVVQPLLSGLIVVLLVLSCAIRSSALHSVPPLAVSSAVLAAALYALKGVLSCVPHVRRLAGPWPAKP